ncbi:MAG: 30S ribosomal protein S20 [Deltaproteobacteria bacterium]|nr:30S ribosomal protein S20 [Deltaproteobacteria bacterium]
MPNHKSAKKRVLQNAKRRVRNRSAVATTRTFVKQARAAIETADVSTPEALARAIKALDSAVTKGLIHRNQASRKISRLTLAANKVTAKL